MVDYITQAKEFLSLKGSITHRDIIQITQGNCPYSTLRALKKSLNLVEEWETMRKRNEKEVQKVFFSSVEELNLCPIHP